MFQPVFSIGRAAREGFLISVLSAGVLSRNMRRIETLVKKNRRRNEGIGSLVIGPSIIWTFGIWILDPSFLDLCLNIFELRFSN